MRVSAYWLRQPIAVGLALLLAVPLGQVASAQTSGAQAKNSPPSQVQPSDSGSAVNPAAESTASTAALPETPTPVSSSSQAAPQQQQNEPLGTAAAPYEKPLGAAVSRPVGAAIAPGKQRRRHIFLISVGLVVGGAVALGTVVALSKGSPSTPSTH